MMRKHRRSMVLLGMLAWIGFVVFGLVIPTAETSAMDAAPTSEGISPFDVGSRAQLFVDRVLVRQTDRIWFTQHEGRKHPENPLLKADQPWEGWRLGLYGNAWYDAEEQLFKMWYLADSEGSDEKYFDAPYVVCYAISNDGIRWQKPLIGTLPTKNGKPHNAVAATKISSVFKDIHDPDPSRRYKMIGRTQRPTGYNTFVSPDGLQWTPFSTSPIASLKGDVITGFWDATRQLYVAFPKQSGDWRGCKRRLFYTITSPDFVHWTEPVLTWTTDLRDDVGSLARIEQVRPLLDRPDDPSLMRTEYYGIGAYTAESCTVGFPWMFTVNNNARWKNQDGLMEVQLAVSRDLMNWERPFRTPVIAHDRVDTWDAGCHATASTAFRFGDEIRLYYQGSMLTHGTPALYREQFEDGRSTGRRTPYTASIGLVTWKLDRFVSVDGPAEGGVLTTVPMKFSGRRLEINAATKPGGDVVVEICDAAGVPIPGFALSDSFSGDDLRHVVTFGGKSDVSTLVGKPIVLRLHLKNAELYTFAFRE